MKKRTAISWASYPVLIAACLTLAIGSGLADISDGDYLGKSKDEIKQTLESQGYKVKEIDRERGLYEIDTVIDGKPYEIKVDPESGKVVNVEEDD